jgi:hypothetical protein
MECEPFCVDGTRGLEPGVTRLIDWGGRGIAQSAVLRLWWAGASRDNHTDEARPGGSGIPLGQFFCALRGAQREPCSLQAHRFEPLEHEPQALQLVGAQ